MHFSFVENVKHRKSLLFSHFQFHFSVIEFILILSKYFSCKIYMITFTNAIIGIVYGKLNI